MTKDECIVGMKVIAISKTCPGATYNYQEFIKKNGNSVVSSIVSVDKYKEDNDKIELRLSGGGLLNFLPADLIPWSVNAEATWTYVAREAGDL